MSRNCSIDELADVINEGLKEYADLAASDMKKAVRKTARAVREDIESGAPVRTGQYAKSWKVKTTEENSQKLVKTVYSPTRYMLAHLLEKATPRGAEGVWPESPTSPRRRRLASSSWRASSKKH